MAILISFRIVRCDFIFHFGKHFFPHSEDSAYSEVFYYLKQQDDVLNAEQGHGLRILGFSSSGKKKLVIRRAREGRGARRFELISFAAHNSWEAPWNKLNIKSPGYGSRITRGWIFNLKARKAATNGAHVHAQTSGERNGHGAIRVGTWYMTLTRYYTLLLNLLEDSCLHKTFHVNSTLLRPPATHISTTNIV